MSEPTAVAEVVGRLRYFEDVKNKHCPTIFQEISDYQTMQQPCPTKEIISARSLRADKRTNDEECGKFWKQGFAVDFLEKKYAAEQNNKECYIRLCELERECIDKDMMRELAAVKLKREHFANVIRNYSEKPFTIFIIPEFLRPEWRKKVDEEIGKKH